MSLGDHLRELRYRVVFSLVWIVLGMVVVAIFYNQVYLFLAQPWLYARDIISATNPEISTQMVLSGVTAPLTLALKICGVGGLVLAAPIWLYQIWAYIVPALLAKEKRWALIFLAVALPLFLAGVTVGYLILPQGISVLMAFTPQSVPITNLIEIDKFLELMLQLMVVFGLGFLMPVVVVGANLVGVLKARQLAKARTYVIFGCFVFGAAATPSTDPFSMLALAVPMALLFVLAEVVCRFNDKRRDRRAAAELVGT
ncbi:twin-arginine translocase subunit TatC [Micropruina sonneratiae]|uniref:twin-arginine translocase subunit TatC n=1 Tax=Micropruina sonneratiae TaxID=2986940 RepID=UPI002226F133|nr:twin-arginine translocase subunit TatC [Micropruina sp. KQZ13P-5]MCW3157948.1 twin-arginine translocase subunit TatC [Micropruina sp. KQZ13P-5]